MSSLVRYKIAMAGVALAALTSGAMAEDAGFSLSDIAVKQAATSQPVADEGNLRRIAGDRSAFFFNGESASSEYPFYALPAEIAGATKLVLTLQTAISAAPERSQLRVFVNDQELGSVHLTAGDAHRVEFNVPNGLIQPGYNAVSVLVEQKHRVDCSIDATYELWTQIDPERSGFVFSGATRSDAASMPDLIALGGIANGRTPIRGHLVQGADSVDIDRTTSVIQSLSIIGSFDRPTVKLTHDVSNEPGIDVVVGTYGTVRDIVGDDATRNLKDGISVRSSSDGNRKMLLVTGRSASDVDAAVTLLTAEAEKQQHDGTPQGLRALTNMKGRLLDPNSQVPLRNLGFITQPFSGRLYKEQVNFSMPSDFYPGDYSALVLHLNAQYAAGLSKDAELVVRANNEVVSDIPLGAGKSGLIRDQRLPIPLNKLRPGENTITFEARLPSAADVVCDPVANLQERPRLLISGDSFLEIPNFARVGRYPDIAALVSGSSLKSKGNSAAPLPVFVPRLNSPALDTAASFLAKMAYSSGHVLSVDITPVMPDAQQPTVMAFGSYGDLPPEMTEKLGLDLEGFAAGANLGAASASNAAAQSTALAPAVAAQIQAPALDAASDGHSFATDAETSLPVDRITRIAGRLAQKAGQGIDRVTHFAAQTLSTLPFNLPGTTAARRSHYQPAAKASFMIAQSEVDPGGAWTVITAPTNAQLNEGLDTVMGRTTWSRLNGSIQSFSASGEVVDQVDPQRVGLFQTQAATIGNLRLVVAGWFSNHVWEYTLAQIGAAIMLGISTFLLLKLGRNR
ncbi:cellulose biosynthesis cyclic di-GMP-binding regulatory protein BcsB [Rhizobium sp. BK376]|uniref:cellulose biosynthesis cyclic di-GMP-binding regulatory protein BcsB n=1 Tax=Rhizobium sp. BK376 TaxID=2512149 RepID=UPI00105071D4|nr:cellulose biosynthesis cyclic di-GMP-binding regulatory protein BcsB [Rhizobium sp. BK376]TCR75601.1 cellulose synthase subunit [Rhizobium sp. BK376]